MRTKDVASRHLLAEIGNILIQYQIQENRKAGSVDTRQSSTLPANEAKPIMTWPDDNTILAGAKQNGKNEKVTSPQEG